MISFRHADDDDMYNVLDIRNATRQYMTHNTNFITTYEQEQWWAIKELNGYRVFIVEYDNVMIGFCMLRTMYDTGKEYGTLAIKEEYRNMGIGTQIYQFLIEQAGEVWIDVRNDNIASYQAAIKAGFQVYHRSDDITVLVYR